MSPLNRTIMNTTFIHRTAQRIPAVALLILLLSACGGSSSTSGAEEGEHHDEEHAAEVTLTPTQISAIGLKTAGLERKTLSGTLKVNGRLMLPPQDQAEVGTLMGGTITRINRKSVV